MSSRVVAVLLAVAACGDDGNQPVAVDAGPGPDAYFDTSVTFTVTQYGAPQVGVVVYFLAPDSTLISMQMTDADGVATADMPAGGTITVAYESSVGSVSLFVSSITGVKPGDRLASSDVYPGALMAPIEFAVPNDGAAKHFVSTPCGRASTTTSTAVLNLTSQCYPVSSVIVGAMDTEDNVLSYGYVPVQFTVGNPVPTDSVALTSQPVTKTYSLTNVPYEGMEIQQSHLDGRGTVATWFTGAQAVAGTATASLKTTPILNGRDLVSIQLGSDDQPLFYIESAPQFSATFTADIGSKLVKERTSEATYDRAASTLTWTETATGVAPDWAVMQFRYGVDNATPARSVFHVITGVPTNGVMTVPKLPVASWNPTADDLTYATWTTGASTGGYDAVRSELNVFSYALATRNFAEFLPRSGGSIAFSASHSQP